MALVESDKDTVIPGSQHAGVHFSSSSRLSFHTVCNEKVNLIAFQGHL